MNHDPTPTSPAGPDPNPNRRPRNDEDLAADGHSSSTGSPRGQRRSQSLSPLAKSGLSKKLAFLLHLLQSLDTLIYAEICTLYYMDCSFFRLLIRWLPHWLFLSVKSDHIAMPLLNYPVGFILGPNLFCMLLHLLAPLPAASEVSRGYLHGGVLVDFVGQKAPTSKFSLLFLDLTVMALQCFMLTVNMEKDRVKRILNPAQQPAGRGNATETTSTTTTTTHTGQDYDAEERGVLRYAPTIDGETDDIELRPLRQDDGDGDNESTTLLERRRAGSYEDLRDALSSGNAILANLHVRSALRTAWNERRNTPENAAAYTLQNVGYNATLAALAAQRRARLAAAQSRTPVVQS